MGLGLPRPSSPSSPLPPPACGTVLSRRYRAGCVARFILLPDGSAPVPGRPVFGRWRAFTSGRVLACTSKKPPRLLQGGFLSFCGTNTFTPTGLRVLGQRSPKGFCPSPQVSLISVTRRRFCYARPRLALQFYAGLRLAPQPCARPRRLTRRAFAGSLKMKPLRAHVRLL